MLLFSWQFEGCEEDLPLVRHACGKRGGEADKPIPGNGKCVAFGLPWWESLNDKTWLKDGYDIK